MAQFRKKPVVIDAFQFISDIPPLDSRCAENTGEMFLQFPVYVDEQGAFLLIDTLEGKMRANSGDWIIKGVKGEFYPCKDDIFQLTYEPLNN